MPQATDTERDLHERILDAIDAGDYPPGARLLETELAETFGVSRTPVREALRRLESQGVVTHEARKGAVVASLDYNQLGELYAVREVMEGLAARLAARFASPAEVQLLRDMIAKDRHRPLKAGAGEQTVSSPIAPRQSQPGP